MRNTFSPKKWRTSFTLQKRTNLRNFSSNCPKSQIKIVKSNNHCDVTALHKTQKKENEMKSSGRKIYNSKKSYYRKISNSGF